MHKHIGRPVRKNKTGSHYEVHFASFCGCFSVHDIELDMGIYGFIRLLDIVQIIWNLMLQSKHYLLTTVSRDLD